MTITYTAQERERIGHGIAEIAACFADNQPMFVKARGDDEVDLVFTGRVSRDYEAFSYAACVMQAVSMLENFNAMQLIGKAANTPPRPNYSKSIADNLAATVKPVEGKADSYQLIVSYKPPQSFANNKEAMEAMNARLKRGCQQARSAASQMI